MKKFPASPGAAAFPWRLVICCLLAVLWAQTGLAQVTFSSRPRTDSAARVAPREPAPAEAEEPPISIPKETSFFPDWAFFPDGVEKDIPRGTSAVTTPPGPLQIGDVTFNQMAESVNVGKGGPVKADDLSRQFRPGAAAAGLTAMVPTEAWLIIGIAVFALLLGLVLGQYENDHEARKRRKHRRHHRHRHQTEEGSPGPQAGKPRNV